MKKSTKQLLIDLFIEKCDPKEFGRNLRNILEENDIKQTELARGIGVDNQTISNWLNENDGYRPKWVDYMYKLNDFLFRKAKNYNPLNLFTCNPMLSKQLHEYFIKKNEDYEEHMKKLELERYIVALGGANGRLHMADWKSVDYFTLFKDSKFHELLENINNNYCKVPIGQRVNIHSREYLQRELFDYFVDFLENGNKRIEQMKQLKKKKEESKK